MSNENSASRQFAVVTGGSNGIGFALAKQFAQNGFDLLIAAEPEGLQAAAESLKTSGAQVDSIAVNLAEYDGVEQLYSRIKAAGRPVDAIAINAGFGLGGDFTRETDLDKELTMIDLNVKSTVHLAKRVLPDMVARKSGKVLFTSSIAGIMPAPLEAVYGATKAFVLMFSEALHNELKDTGVTTTALMPGPTETNFFHRSEMDNTNVGGQKKDDPNEVAQQGFEGLMKGEAKVHAGSLKTRIQAAATEVLPDSFTAQQHRGMAEKAEK